MRRYLPMVEELAQSADGKDLLAYLLDSYYWK
jgi:hypothetical protein